MAQAKKNEAENRKVQQHDNVDISAIVAIQNMGEKVEEYYTILKNALEGLGATYEIIYVDDASEDNTYENLENIAAKDPATHLIRMRSTFGESSSFEAGFKMSMGERVIFYTTRVRPDSSRLPALLEKLDEGNDLVVGWRFPRKDAVINRIISKVFNFMTNRLTGIKLHDINSGIIVTRRDVLENLQIYGGLGQFIPVLANKQGYKVAEEKIAQLGGFFRKSRFMGEYLQRVLDILTVLFLTKYSKKPIHFLGFLGGVFAVAGAIIELYLFFYRIFGFGAIAGRPLLLLGALLLVIGIQMIAMGLIGEMIIFTHAGDIKEYNIEKVYH